MSRHKTGYVISYHGILCHNMSYVTTIAASLSQTILYVVWLPYVQYVTEASYICTTYHIHTAVGFIVSLQILQIIIS